jgi:hypothetical protein
MLANIHNSPVQNAKKQAINVDDNSTPDLICTYIAKPVNVNIDTITSGTIILLI